MIVFDADIFTLFAYGQEKVKKRYDKADDVFAVTYKIGEPENSLNLKMEIPRAGRGGAPSGGGP